MKNALIALVAIATALALTAGAASAGQCPLLIKQLNEAVGKASGMKAEEAKKLIAEAQKLHETGKHAESVATCDEAAKVLGVKLQKKM